MFVVCNDRFTFVNGCGNRVWYVRCVSQPTEPACVSHPFDARHKWQNLDRQLKNFFEGGFAKSRSLGKIGRVIESKNMKLV